MKRLRRILTFVFLTLFRLIADNRFTLLLAGSLTGLALRAFERADYWSALGCVVYAALCGGISWRRIGRGEVKK